MGLMLSVLVFCVGVLEALSCLEHIKQSYLPFELKKRKRKLIIDLNTGRARHVDAVWPEDVRHEHVIKKRHGYVAVQNSIESNEETKSLTCVDTACERPVTPENLVHTISGALYENDEEEDDDEPEELEEKAEEEEITEDSSTTDEITEIFKPIPQKISCAAADSKQIKDINEPLALSSDNLDNINISEFSTEENKIEKAVKEHNAKNLQKTAVTKDDNLNNFETAVINIESADYSSVKTVIETNNHQNKEDNLNKLETAVSKLDSSGSSSVKAVIDTKEVSNKKENVNKQETAAIKLAESSSVKAVIDTKEVNNQQENVNKQEKASIKLESAESSSVKAVIDTKEDNNLQENVNKQETAAMKLESAESSSVKAVIDTKEVNNQQENVNNQETAALKLESAGSSSVKTVIDTKANENEAESVNKQETSVIKLKSADPSSVKTVIDTEPDEIKEENVNKQETADTKLELADFNSVKTVIETNKNKEENVKKQETAIIKVESADSSSVKAAIDTKQDNSKVDNVNKQETALIKLESADSNSVKTAIETNKTQVCSKSNANNVEYSPLIYEGDIKNHENLNITENLTERKSMNNCLIERNEKISSMKKNSANKDDCEKSQMKTVHTQYKEEYGKQNGSLKTLNIEDSTADKKAELKQIEVDNSEELKTVKECKHQNEIRKENIGADCSPVAGEVKAENITKNWEKCSGKGKKPNKSVSAKKNNDAEIKQAIDNFGDDMDSGKNRLIDVELVQCERIYEKSKKEKIEFPDGNVKHEMLKMKSTLDAEDFDSDTVALKPAEPLKQSSMEEVEDITSPDKAFWLIFSGEYTKAMSKDWHSGHFCCWQCDESLTGQRYVLRDDHPYCIKCYESVFANTCDECNKTIGIDSKDLSYKDKHWHEACFFCNKCRVSLVDKQFGSKADKIYCGNCYDAQFASRCDGCGQIFRAGTKKMEYKTRQWHEQCFCCCVCKTPIGTKSFIPREQEIYCATCYEEKFATRCVKCNKIITSGGVTYKNEPWHRECFTCTNCNTSLAGQRFTSREEKPYCADCFGELFAKRCTACCKPITGIGGTRFISFEDRHWHNDCFICASCKTSLVGRGFITDADDILCTDCAKQKLM